MGMNINKASVGKIHSDKFLNGFGTVWTAKWFFLFFFFFLATSGPPRIPCCFILFFFYLFRAVRELDMDSFSAENAPVNLLLNLSTTRSTKCSKVTTLLILVEFFPKITLIGQHHVFYEDFSQLIRRRFKKTPKN